MQLRKQKEREGVACNGNAVDGRRSIKRQGHVQAERILIVERCPVMFAALPYG